jgi:hypothetical protein
MRPVCDDFYDHANSTRDELILKAVVVRNPLLPVPRPVRRPLH